MFNHDETREIDFIFYKLNWDTFAVTTCGERQLESLNKEAVRSADQKGVLSRVWVFSRAKE